MFTIGMLCLTFVRCIYLYYLLFISLFNYYVVAITS